MKRESSELRDPGKENPIFFIQILPKYLADLKTMQVWRDSKQLGESLNNWTEIWAIAYDRKSLSLAKLTDKISVLFIVK